MISFRILHRCSLTRLINQRYFADVRVYYCRGRLQKERVEYHVWEKRSNIRFRILQLRNDLEDNQVESRREFHMLQSNIRRITIQPVGRRAVAPNEPNDGEAGGAVAQVSTLSVNP